MNSAERPGDVVIYGLEGKKAGLVDVAIIEPLLANHIDRLAVGGSGAAATAYAEGVKIKKYANRLDPAKEAMIPFIVETTGGLSTSAK